MPSLRGWISWLAKGLEKVMFVHANSHWSVYIVQPPIDCFVRLCLEESSLVGNKKEKKSLHQLHPAASPGTSGLVRTEI